MENEKQFDEREYVLSQGAGDERKEEVVEVSRRERILFSYLDRLGSAAEQLLEKVYGNLPEVPGGGPEPVPGSARSRPEDTLEQLDDLERQAGALTLTGSQRALLARIIGGMKETDRRLSDLAKKDGPDVFVSAAMKAAGVSDKNGRGQVAVLRLPAAVGLVIGGQGGGETGYYPRREPRPDDPLVSNVFVVEGAGKEAVKTARHEYLHLLMARYIEPNEIAPFSGLIPSELLAEVDKKQAEIAALQVELGDAADEEEISDIYERIRLRNVELCRLRAERDGRIDRSDEYLIDAAGILFRNMRDELAAHAIEGSFMTEERALLPGRSGTFESWLEDLRHAPDSEKIRRGWERLKMTLSYCRIMAFRWQIWLPYF